MSKMGQISHQLFIYLLLVVLLEVVVVVLVNS